MILFEILTAIPHHLQAPDIKMARENLRNKYSNVFKKIPPIDRTAPIIKILTTQTKGKGQIHRVKSNGDVITLINRSENKSNIDEGAICTDYVDGDLIEAVKVTAEVVSKSANKYTIAYNCNDTSGNKAKTKRRIVFVKGIPNKRKTKFN